jgi:hypothetical protein
MGAFSVWGCNDYLRTFNVTALTLVGGYKLTKVEPEIAGVNVLDHVSKLVVNKYVALVAKEVWGVHCLVFLCSRESNSMGHEPPLSTAGF